MNDFTKRLCFDEEKHEYSVDGIKLPSVTEIVSPFTFSKYRVDAAVVNQAAYRGKIIHEVCAGYDMGAIDNEQELAPDIAMYLKAWKDFCHDYRAEWLLIEQPMSCVRFAGTVDRVGIIDGNPVVVDIKTTSSMDRASKIALCCQLAGYTILVNDNTDYDISLWNCMGVQLTKDGKYNVIYLSRTEGTYDFSSFDLFYKLLEIHKAVKGEKKVG